MFLDFPSFDADTDDRRPFSDEKAKTFTQTCARAAMRLPAHVVTFPNDIKLAMNAETSSPFNALVFPSRPTCKSRCDFGIKKRRRLPQFRGVSGRHVSTYLQAFKG